jgi:6-phosphofructokinase 2
MMIPMTRTTTLTLNPSVDLLTTTPQVMDTHKMRCTAPIYHPGGGGINVARVVHRLGGAVQAVWLGGGALGQQLAALLAQEELDHRQLVTPQETRLSFSVHENQTARDYRFVLPGPDVDPMVLDPCLQDFYQCAADSLCWVVSGSLAPGMPEGVYADIARQAQAMGKHLIIDASGPALLAALRVGAFMVKPSLREMEEIAGQALPTHALRLAQARQWLAQWPIQIIALSLGAEGAMLVTRDGAWLSPGLPVTVRSTIGAGDSFVGGFVSAMAQVQFNTDPSALLLGFRHGMAASAAALSSLGTALCEAQDVTDLLGRVNISPLTD